MKEYEAQNDIWWARSGIMSKSNSSQMLEQELMKTESEMMRDFLLEKLIWN